MSSFTKHFLFLEVHEDGAKGRCRDFLGDYIPLGEEILLLLLKLIKLYRSLNFFVVFRWTAPVGADSPGWNLGATAAAAATANLPIH